MLLVQEYLETHSFAELAAEHGIYASFSKSGHKWSMNYDQIEAKESNPLAQQCRGVVFAEETGKSFKSQAIEVNDRLKYDHIIPGKTVVLAYPMDRFFNHGQGSAADVNWSDPNLAILEKLDGTLTILYYDIFTKEWCVATRSCPDADIPLDGALFTFRTLFEKALLETASKSFYEFTNELYRTITYCFELTSPYNRVVVDYKNSRLTLIAARCIFSGKEINIDNVDVYNVPHVQSHIFTNVTDLLDWVSNQNPLEHEGVVVRDSNFKRLKVKNASYVAFNRARDILGTSERNCLELVLAGKEDDVIPALPPEIVERIVKIKYSVTAMFKDYDRTYNLLKYVADQINSGDKKTFAMMVNGYKDIWTAPMFSIYSGKMTNMKDFIAKNRNEGTWSNSFLDKVLMIIKNY
jgi:hypothetical protein